MPSLRLCLLLLGLVALVPASERPQVEEFEAPRPDDFILLANRHRLPGYIVARDDDADPPTVTIRTRSGLMVLPRSALATVSSGFAARQAALADDDHEERVVLAREALHNGRSQEAFDLLSQIPSQHLGLEGLRLLATLTDALKGNDDIEAVLDLYRRYRDAGGRDPLILQRLETLEGLLREYEQALAGHRQQREEMRIDDGYEAADGWTSEDPQWANPSTPTVVDSPDGLQRVLRIAYVGGSEDKAAILRRWRLDPSNSPILQMSVSNPGDASISLSVAVKTGDNWEYFESRPYPIRPGEDWSQISFDLSGSDFKSESSNWRHSSNIANLHDIKELQVQIHNGRRDGTLYINNMGFAARSGD